jgi:hypothetical protein
VDRLAEVKWLHEVEAQRRKFDGQISQVKVELK